MSSDFSNINLEFERVYGFIKQKVTNGFFSVPNPQSYILGGQPGAGKTTIQNILSDSDSNIIIINADDFRQYHPHFDAIQTEYGTESPKYTQPFINAVTEKLIDDLSSEKYNLIIEGTLRTAEVPISTAQKLKAKGYRTELCVMAVKPEISYESTILRYENAIAFGEIPRATSKEHHDMVVDRIADNLDAIYKTGIFDCICIYTRDNGCIYSSDTSNQMPSEIEKKILTGEWSGYEKENLLYIVQQIQELKRKRSAEDLSEYVSHSEKLLEKLGISVLEKKEKSAYMKINDLTVDQVAHLAAEGVPFTAKKTGDNKVTIVFKREKAESIKTILLSFQESQQKKTPSPKKPKL